MVKKHMRQPVMRSTPSILTLLRNVPTNVFVQMVTKSGIPAHQARELCKQFKELKA